jgi:16S rRNA (guanine1516-N2)-methyltransferase
LSSPPPEPLTPADLLLLDTTSGPGRSLQAPLLKAVGIRKGDPYRPVVVDATAGYGQDAWLLASHGCRVIAIERVPQVHAVLRESLDNAARVRSQIAGRIQLIHGNAIDLLRRFADHGEAPGHDEATRPAVICIDPMFPLGRKAAERGAMRALRAVTGADDDAQALLDAALACGGRGIRRVVVKRPRHAEVIGGRQPTVTHRGRAIRVDVYAGAAFPPGGH